MAILTIFWIHVQGNLFSHTRCCFTTFVYWVLCVCVFCVCREECSSGEFGGSKVCNIPHIYQNDVAFGLLECAISAPHDICPSSFNPWSQWNCWWEIDLVLVFRFVVACEATNLVWLLLFYRGDCLSPWIHASACSYGRNSVFAYEQGTLYAILKNGPYSTVTISNVLCCWLGLWGSCCKEYHEIC
jgi:hypothetical protein